MKQVFKAILITGLCLGGVITLSGGAFIVYFGYQIDQASKPTTDISRYPEIRGSSEPDNPLMAHFPRDIPSYAKNVKFYHVPGFLQGGTIVQLRMQLPAEEIAALKAKFQPKAKRQYIPNGTNNSPKTENSPDGSVITYEYPFYTGEFSAGDPVPTFPEDYAIYVLEDTQGPPEYDWNHPESYGVAINETTLEIVYWMDDW